MSEISVNRTAAGGYCLIIDGTRVAGGKPEFSSDNCFYWWETDKTIGVVDDIVEEVESWKAANKKLRKSIDETCAGWAEAYETLEAENEKLTEQCNRLLDKTLELGTENAKLRELLQDMQTAFVHGNCYRWCRFKEPCDGDRCQYLERMHDLGIEVQP